MKMRAFLTILLTFVLSFQEGQSDELVVGVSPRSIRFGKGSSLYLSDLDKVLAGCLGYTTQSIIWRGLTVTSPFKYASAAVVFGIRSGGVSVQFEGASYELKEDASLKEASNSLTDIIGNSAQRPVHFEYISAEDLTKDASKSEIKTRKLEANRVEVAAFLKQMSALPNIVDYLAAPSSLGHGGQDIVFVDVESFAPIVQKYGKSSPQVKEASSILRAYITDAIANIDKFYDHNAVVMVAMLSDKDPSLVRKKRETLIEDDAPATIDLNLASVYSEDYPVIFNIILVLAIVLTVALIAISMSMAFMDPGRDSIIYRMTNPRMKKDQ